MQPNRPEREATASTRQRGASRVEELISPAAWLVLALVIEQSSHGYEIRGRYQRRFGSIMPVSVPRLYGALDRLRDAGLIEPIAQRRGRSASKQEMMRRSYRATDAGVEAYHRWLSEQMRDDAGRPQLVGQIVSAGLLGSDVLVKVIDRYQRECVEELRALPAPTGVLETGQASLEELTESLIVDQQRRELAARNDWAAYARAVLAAHALARARQSSDVAEGDA